ncbi:hypothetical protein O6H91_21G010800 [Diphasiastrum complanatum]|uniref:Uncharacterized protein n=1 Tax=Diphasiastrum complanatum TaxID=34168 RepID=A0ACC2AJJ5_DIPCM|nr:hypothetical protein O6H91_21G010800 [Diphasiastrum complanatum]
MQAPLVHHWKSAKRVLRYVSNSRFFGILYERSNLHLRAYSDSDFVGDKMDRNSISAFAIFLCGGVISWLSKMQDTISLSSCEPEYKALTSTTKELLWLRRLLMELHVLEVGRSLTYFVTIQLLNNMLQILSSMLEQSILR